MPSAVPAVPVVPTSLSILPFGSFSPISILLSASGKFLYLPSSVSPPLPGNTPFRSVAGLFLPRISHFLPSFLYRLRIPSNGISSPPIPSLLSPSNSSIPAVFGAPPAKISSFAVSSLFPEIRSVPGVRGNPSATDAFTSTSNPSPRIADIISTLSVPICESLRLRFGPISVDVATSIPNLVPFLLDYFQEFTETPCDLVPRSSFFAHEFGSATSDLVRSITMNIFPQGSKVPKEEFADLADGRIVRLLDSGMLYLLTDEADFILCPFPSVDNFRQVTSFLCKRFCRNLDYPVGHCSAVSRDGRAIAFAGVAGAGKSTLALRLMASDPSLLFMCNDRLLITPYSMAIGCPRQPRVNPGTLVNNPFLSSILTSEEVDLYSSLSSESLRLLELKYDVPIHRCFGPGRFLLSSPLVAIFILRWEHQSPYPTTIRPMNLADHPDLLPTLLKPTSVYGCFMGCSFPPWDEKALLDFLRPIPVYEIVGSVDFAAAASLCLPFLSVR